MHKVIDPDVDDPNSEYMNSTQQGTSDVLNVSTNRSRHVRVQQIRVNANVCCILKKVELILCLFVNV